MHSNTQLQLPYKENFVKEIDDWTFRGANTRDLTHCYHDYPARMIPQVASKLLDKFGNNARLLFDPYCGTGTSLVEAVIRGIDAVGTDLNPLAQLISQAKTSAINKQKLDYELKKFRERIAQATPDDYSSTLSQIHGITCLDFWFKPIVIKKLFFVQKIIDDIEDKETKIFFQTAFSETVRESSNTRIGEFKLYRYNEEKLKGYDPDVFSLIINKLQRNHKGLEKFLKILDERNFLANTHIYNFNSAHNIPTNLIKDSSVDIVVTSPPYGDSHTTVAYGQYSRLSAAWLELANPNNIDSKLMGGKTYKEKIKFPCEQLNTSLAKICLQDKKRADEVASFYFDLYQSITNVSKVIRPKGYACYVVGNRKVKGITLPTDNAIKCFFESNAYKHVDTFIRSIPNKRMPLKNSPTNISGILENTMASEYIVVMQR